MLQFKKGHVSTCGIVGFTGTNQAAPILLDGLSKLEYRDYDSAGIAVRDGEKAAEIIKEKGKLKVLADMTDNGKAPAASVTHAGQRTVSVGCQCASSCE